MLNKVLSLLELFHLVALIVADFNTLSVFYLFVLRKLLISSS